MSNSAIDYYCIFTRSLSVALFVCLLQACGKPAYVPVVERAQPPTEKINSHWVSSGETLYAIAWRYNMDPVVLARANRLSAPYRIKAGQKLNLDLSAVKSTVVASSRSNSKSSGGASAARNSRPVAKSPTRVSSPKGGGQQAYKSFGRWHWPVKGAVSRRYSAGGPIHKGLDIRGQHGQAIYAANQGVVVYAGSGLPAYGKLLIVKHNNTYLSAYAHNSKLTVIEGDKVKVGQKIAEMGNTGTTHNHLHFEIRKLGKPIDPLIVLPKA